MNLAQDLLDRMAAAQADFTLTFRRLSEGETLDPELFGEWQARWRERVAREDGDPLASMRSVNPRFIPRNHRVEQAIRAAVDNDDFALFEMLVKVLAAPFDNQRISPPTPTRRSPKRPC